MGRLVTTTIGYGFRLPQSAIDSIEDDDGSVFDVLEQITEDDPLLTWSMGYWGDYYEDRPYAITLTRLTDEWTGIGVHEGPDQSLGTDISNDEVSAFIRALNKLGVKPDFITLRWLTVVSIGE